LGIPLRSDVCVEAVCRVADDVRMQGKPQTGPERTIPRARFTLSKKRGGR
jgi:hypothetical protein